MQKILGPGELDDSAVSQNCPSWMTQNKYVPLAARPESPSVRNAKRNDLIGVSGRTALMESLVNLEDYEDNRLQPIQQQKRFMRTSNIKTFYVPSSSIPDPSHGSWGVHAKLSNSQKIKKRAKSYADLQPNFVARHKGVYSRDPEAFRMRLGSCASFGMSIKNSANLLRKDGIGMLPSLERKQQRLKKKALQRAMSNMEREIRQFEHLNSTQGLRASQSEKSLMAFSTAHIGNLTTEIHKQVTLDQMKNMVRGSKYLFAPVKSRSQRSTSRSRSAFRAKTNTPKSPGKKTAGKGISNGKSTARSSKNTSRSSRDTSRAPKGTSRSRKNSFVGSDLGDDDDRPQYVFEQQLAEQNREQLLLILGYQHCAEKCKIAAIERTKRLEAEARRETNMFRKTGDISDFGRRSIANFFQSSFRV